MSDKYKLCQRCRRENEGRWHQDSDGYWICENCYQDSEDY